VVRVVDVWARGSGGRAGRAFDGEPFAGWGRGRMVARAASPECGSRMRRGRSERDGFGGRTRGAGLLFSRRLGPRELGEWSRELSREWPFGSRRCGAVHLSRSALTALTMRSLSPTLEMRISLRVS
jgi:hypothetical protein